MAETPTTTTVLPRSPVISALTASLRSVLIPVLAVFTAVIIGSLFILLAGLDPFKAFSGLLSASLGNDAAIVQSLLRMAPLILAGLSVAFAFKGGLFNIGAQG